MRSHVIALFALATSFAACQSGPDPQSSLPTPSSPSAAAITLQASTPTALPTLAIQSAPQPETHLPPNGQYLDYLRGLDQDIFALTIDDGYGKMPFDEILNELRSRDIQATFFLVAEASINLGLDRMQQLAEDGHTIAYHSYAHEDLAIVEDWDEPDWLADYAAWETAMRLLLADDLYVQLVRPYARAPYGLFNRDFLGMTEEMSLIPVGWSRDPGDLNIGLEVRPGDIFLLHVRYPDAELLPALLDEIDLRPVSLDELFAAWQPE